MQDVAFQFRSGALVVQIAKLSSAAGDAHRVNSFFHQLRILFGRRQREQLAAPAGNPEAVERGLFGLNIAAFRVDLGQHIVIAADA